VPPVGVWSAGRVQQVVELELALLTPAVRRSRERLEQLLDPDFAEVGASGRRWSRAEMIAALVAEDRAAEPLEAVDVTCLQAGPDLLVLTYLSQPQGRAALRTSLWRRSGGRWRLLHHQGTLVQPAPPA